MRDRLLIMALGLAPVLPSPALAQDAGAYADIEGLWSGAVVLPTGELAFSVTFRVEEGALGATMDIPSQANGLPLIEVAYTDGQVHFELDASIGLATWDGARDGDAVEGEFTQGGIRATFYMNRGEAVVVEEPEEPVPYGREEIAVENGAVHLEGTLTIPEGEGPFPAVVMITGSGAQNRDEEIYGFRIFRVIADHLTRAGIAVYRYDDRGVGGSAGSVALSTTEDFAGDVLAAIGTIAEHPDIDAERIGLVGHSEGAVVAPLAASRSDAVKFAVLLAGTSVTGAEVIYDQGAKIARASGASEEDIAWTIEFQTRLFAALAAGEDIAPYRDELEAELRRQVAEMTPAEKETAGITDVDQYIARTLSAQLEQVQVPWFRFFLSYDPAPALRLTSVPVLALFGDLDLQVTPELNYGPMAEALGGNPDVTFHTFPDANHLFQKAETGSPEEYPLLEKAFVDGFLEMIADWVNERFGNE